jgi:hypothetical protein
MRERHNIYLKKRAGCPKPWTNDPIMQQYFFTNPYRENDKTTEWFRERVREPLRDSIDVFMATVIFRWFNLISTGELLIKNDLLEHWNEKVALHELGKVRATGKPVFTGAFMINSPGGIPKLEAICARISNVWRDRFYLREKCLLTSETMEAVHEELVKYPGLGGFMAYEIVCDLRYTYWLEEATDKLTWCNPGPGAIRGLYRLLGRDFPKGNNASSPPVPSDWAKQTQKLLKTAQRRLKGMPPLEMREIEMSLCEVDKYLRLQAGDGRAKRRYNGS